MEHLSHGGALTKDTLQQIDSLRSLSYVQFTRDSSKLDLMNIPSVLLHIGLLSTSVATVIALKFLLFLVDQSDVFMKIGHLLSTMRT